MIHMDDRTIMFANPEDAAEFIGDIRPRWPGRPSRDRRPVPVQCRRVAAASAGVRRVPGFR